MIGHLGETTLPTPDGIVLCNHVRKLRARENTSFRLFVRKAF